MHYTDGYVARFWAKVNRADDEDGRHGPPADQNSRGGQQYGAVRPPEHSRRMFRAHRESYEMNVGPIPEGMQVDHICRNSLCMNPKHLRLVTPSQNLQNLSGAGRATSGRRGVHWNKQHNKWQVGVTVNGVHYTAGRLFVDVEEADRAAIALRNRLFTHNDVDRRS
jgi:hypothetical protein